jgi:hypothetical protein
MRRTQPRCNRKAESYNDISQELRTILVEFDSYEKAPAARQSGAYQRLSPMELRHPRYFTAIVQWKGYREPSRHLYVAQPSISKVVADLEGVRSAPEGEY